MKRYLKSMLEFLKRLLTLRIRKRRRFTTKDGVYVVMENSYLKNQVSNISMGGLAFNYEDQGYKLGKGSYELKVIADKSIVLDRVPFKRVSDFPVGEVLYPYRKIKRFSVQFEGLTSAQKTQLKYFLQNNTIGRS
jgi:hypothetical protein